MVTRAHAGVNRFGVLKMRYGYGMAAHNPTGA